MTDREKEIELLAKELCEICCYPAPNPWDEEDRSVWRIRADILMDKGYRRPSHDSKEPLDFQEVLGVLLNAKPQEINTNYEIDLDKVATLICAKFSAPRISVEDLAKAIYDTEPKRPGKLSSFDECKWSYKRQAETILRLITKTNPAEGKGK